MGLPELPVGYYRDNFLLLLDHGDSLYGDLLGGEEQAFSAAFRRGSLDAQRLYVRLISRKGPVFRGDRLRYGEIGDLAAAAAELEAAGLLAVDRPEDLRAAVGLLRRDELLAILAEEGGLARPGLARPGLARPGHPLRSLSLPQLVERCLGGLPEAMVARQVQRRFRTFAPLGARAVLIYRLLFFGNPWQDLTEFVLSDLGLVRYEAYPIAPGDRLFTSRAGLENTLRLIELAEHAREAAGAGDTAALRQIVAGLPPDGGEELPGLREGLLVEAGRHLERAGEAADALAVYRLAAAPPARERQARLLDRLGRPEEALAVCRRILEEPADEAELQFAARFAPRLERRLPGQVPTAERPPRVPSEVLRPRWTDDMGVEEAVLEHFRRRGWEGYHTENALWCGLFGLAFWDIVFLPVPGAFHNRFQRGPRDLFSPQFRRRRSGAIERRLAEIRDSDRWTERLRGTCERSRGVANALVAWERLPPRLIETALERIPRAHLHLIFDRLAAHPGLHRSGLPDLVLFPPAAPPGRAGYELVEVKGPGDQLRPNQERWLRFLRGHGIPARLVRVERG